MQPLSRKSEHFTDSVIRRMTRISLQYNAINLAQGFPDFDPPKAMTDRLAEVSAEEKNQVSHRAQALKVFYRKLKEAGYAEQ